MRRRAFLTAVAGSIGAIAGCFGSASRALPDEPRGEWLQQSHDSMNTGASDVIVPLRGNPAWDAGDAGSIEPLVSDGTVFSVGANATALDARTGDQEWEHEFSDQTSPTPALTETEMIVPTDRRIVVLSRDDGSEQRSVSLPWPAEGRENSNARTQPRWLPTVSYWWPTRGVSPLTIQMTGHDCARSRPSATGSVNRRLSLSRRRRIDGLASFWKRKSRAERRS